MRFTRKKVSELTLPTGRPYVIVWDEALPGFGVRVNPSGKVWVVQYRTNGKSHRETVGRVDAVTLDSAREAARTTLARVQLGADPRAERAEAEALRAATFETVALRYLQSSIVRLKPRSYEEVERHLKKHWACFSKLPIHVVGRPLIASRLEEIANDSGPIAANRARASLSALFAYALGMGLAEVNPVVGTLKLGEEIKRDHVLTDDEVASIWRSCGENDYGRIVRLLILTAQRRDEIGGIKWAEVDFDSALWTIPAARSKNRKSHEVPLSNAALSILKEAPRVLGRDRIFGSGQGGFSGWSKAKSELDVRTRAVFSRLRPWRIHDLRRTTATGMANLGIQPHIIEATLNHLSGTRAGVAGIYNRATYSQEKRDALDRWSEHVEKVIT